MHLKSQWFFFFFFFNALNFVCDRELSFSYLFSKNKSHENIIFLDFLRLTSIFLYCVHFGHFSIFEGAIY